MCDWSLCFLILYCTEKMKFKKNIIQEHIWRAAGAQKVTVCIVTPRIPEMCSLTGNSSLQCASSLAPVPSLRSVIYQNVTCADGLPSHLKFGLTEVIFLSPFSVLPNSPLYLLSHKYLALTFPSP